MTQQTANGTVDLKQYMQDLGTRVLENHEENRRRFDALDAGVADINRTLRTLTRTGQTEETPAALGVPAHPHVSLSSRVAAVARQHPRMALALTIGAGIGSAVAAFLAQYHPQ
jgi:NCAIR mutase (PurE)-related protein